MENSSEIWELRLMDSHQGCKDWWEEVIVEISVLNSLWQFVLGEPNHAAIGL